MRSYDLTPLYRSTVGFDRLFSLLDSVAGAESAAPGYPPYNIERTDENAYRITVAVAGFGEKDLAIEVKETTLTVRGEKAAEEKKSEVLHQGIAARAFERRFQLADHVQVTGASLENGLLHVELVREVPEAKKPRVIAIGGVKPAAIDAKAVEQKQAASSAPDEPSSCPDLVRASISSPKSLLSQDDGLPGQAP